MLKDAGGSLELESIADLLPGLKTVPGLSSWVLSDKQGNIYKRSAGLGKYFRKDGGVDIKSASFDLNWGNYSDCVAFF